MFKSRIIKKLNHQKRMGLYRCPMEISERQGKHVIVNGKKVLNFASNDYLGLGSSERLRQKVAAHFQKYGASSSSSRLVSANFNAISEAEHAFAEFFGYPSCLFFPSGYQANIGLLSTIFERQDTIFFDKHVHASAVKGMLLSKSQMIGFRHNSMTHLERRLKKYAGKSICGLVTESLFSMDGDLIPLEAIYKLRKTFDLVCIVDEAHTFGVLGCKGRGIAKEVADIAIGTFGKALGLFGAFILGPEWIRDYLMNFSSPMIYTTSLPEAHGASALDIIEMIKNSDNERHNLSQVTAFMKKSLEREGFKVSGDAHILALQIGDETQAVNLTKHLLEKGFLTFPARYPTVPPGKAIIRISMNAMHQDADVKLFMNALLSVVSC